MPTKINDDDEQNRDRLTDTEMYILIMALNVYWNILLNNIMDENGKLKAYVYPQDMSKNMFLLEGGYLSILQKFQNTATTLELEKGIQAHIENYVNDMSQQPSA